MKLCVCVCVAVSSSDSTVMLKVESAPPCSPCPCCSPGYLASGVSVILPLLSYLKQSSYHCGTRFLNQLHDVVDVLEASSQIDKTNGSVIAFTGEFVSM